MTPAPEPSCCHESCVSWQEGAIKAEAAYATLRGRLEVEPLAAMIRQGWGLDSRQMAEKVRAALLEGLP